MYDLSDDDYNLIMKNNDASSPNRRGDTASLSEIDTGNDHRISPDSPELQQSSTAGKPWGQAIGSALAAGDSSKQGAFGSTYQSPYASKARQVVGAVVNMYAPGAGAALQR